MTENVERRFLRRKTQDYYFNDHDKGEALMSINSLPDVLINKKGVISNQINQLLNKFYYWKNSYYNHIKAESLTGTIFVLLCITFGSGILSLPYSIKCVGIIPALLLFSFSAFVSIWTLKLLLKLAFKNDIMDYCSLVEKYYDHKIVIFTEIVNLI